MVWRPTSPVVDLAYVLDTKAECDRSVAPDGRCGLAFVDGVLWWFGPQTTPWTPARSGVHVVGVRLSLSAGRRAAGGPLRQWQNLRVPLSTVWEQEDVNRLARQAASATSDTERVDLLVTAIGARVDAARCPDGAAAALVGLVLTDSPVSEIAGRVGLSPRQVHRRCLQEFGLPPSVLRRIARVHRAAIQATTTGQPSLAQLAVDAGFADQAHFCREIRAMSGATPSAVFG